MAATMQCATYVLTLCVLFQGTKGDQGEMGLKGENGTDGRMGVPGDMVSCV